MVFLLALIGLATMKTLPPSSCPLPSELDPCYCEHVPMTFQITCPVVENEDALDRVVHALRHSSSFFRFTIRNGMFRFIPHDVFKGLSFQELEIIDSSFVALSDTDSALEGLEESLKALAIKNSTVLGDWDWLLLRKLTSITKLHVDVDLQIVSEDINMIGSAGIVRDLTLSDNRIMHLDDGAFAGFHKLGFLSLRNNLISELKRSMFPNPGDSLRHLDFGGNLIRSLPSDLFDTMPYVSSVFVHSNKLLTLPEQPFSTIWSQLTNFYATDNDLRCDCRMAWITKQAFPKHMKAACAEPPRLQGKNFNELKASDLWC